MSVSDLETALESLDSQIADLAARAADAKSYSIEGLAVVRASLAELVAARKVLVEAIKASGANVWELHSRWIT